MSYPADKSHLYALIEQAMNAEEIRDSLKRVPIDYDTLRESAMENADRIWEAAAEQIKEVDLLEIRRKKMLTRVPAFFRPLFYIYQLLRSIFISGSSGDSKITEDLEIARYKADEALIQYGIMPQLRGILNEVFWGSYERQKGRKEKS